MNENENNLRSIFFQTAAEVGPVDPHMERQVETINKLVTSYMQIVAKMTRDYIPKTIMYHIVQNVRRYSNFSISIYR